MFMIAVYEQLIRYTYQVSIIIIILIVISSIIKMIDNDTQILWMQISIPKIKIGNCRAQFTIAYENGQVGTQPLCILLNIIPYHFLTIALSIYFSHYKYEAS